jgi:uncharacterized membrane protein YwaF
MGLDGGSMNFELWSFFHILYIVSPFILFALIYLAIRNKTDNTKYILGVVLGVLSILILIVRNVDIFIRSGMDEEVIPLQVCHIGSLVAGLALIFKKKWLLITAFCFNLLPALLAMVFADALVNYDTLLKIRPQTYIWGHILIIVCAMYGMFVYKPKLTKKDLIHSIYFVFVMAIVAITCNSAFREYFGYDPNYFYLFDYTGTPLKFLYNVMPSSSYGWFTINWFYVISLLTFFLLVFVLLHYISTIIIKKIESTR